MNYRHAFHAGAFSDVVKHAVFALLIERLKEKPAAFAVLDTHAGLGQYDLQSEVAQKTGEWQLGIGRLLEGESHPLLRSYLEIARAHLYPGSPRIARALLRPQDRLTACELEPSARKRLIDALRRDTQARVVDLDGFVALPAFVPPNERRGLVVIDPAFEQKDEFARLADRVVAAVEKWPTGSYLIWYPAKSRRATDGLAARVAEAAASVKPSAKCLRLEFSVALQTSEAALASSGLLIVNPPWTLQSELRIILAELEKPLGQGGAGRFRLETPKTTPKA